MTFTARLDRERLAKVAFGDDWLALVDPADGGACDPFDVRTRMALYRLLIERGALGALSPFWGFASQLAWQRRSGRLGAGHAIDPASWWGACNYALSVIPYLAAMELAIVPALPLPAVAREYAPALAAWRDAFRAMDGDLEPMRFAVWRAHLTSIEIAVRLHRAALAAMPADERRFARGWVRMVDLFGAAAIRTDLERLAEHGDATLPGRVLGGGLADLSRAERSAVRRVCALGDRPAWRWSLELAVWRRIMRTRAARDEAEALLAGMFSRSRRAWPLRLRALRYALVAK